MALRPLVPDLAPPPCPCPRRHLVFCLLDLLLELLVPEVSDQDFQNRLMEELSRSPERSPM